MMILSLLGSISYLNDNNLLNNIKSYYSVSVGAILSTMLALDYSIDEIKDFLINFNLVKFLNDYDITNFIDNYGFSLGLNRNIIAQSIISYKLGEENINYTFKQLYDDKKIKLNIFATCIEDKTLYKFSNDNNENTPIWKALVASCNIPYIFVPIEINNKRFIDGSIINSYPINYILDNELSETLGLNIDYSYDLNFKYFNDIPNLQYYLETLFLYFFNKFNYTYNNTIKINIINNYQDNILKYDGSNEDKYKLIDIGYNITKEYFELKKFNNYKIKLKKSKSCIF